MAGKFQFVSWFPEWRGFRFIKTKRDRGMYMIFKWYLFLGFWELRRWVPKSQAKARLKEYNNRC